MNEFKIKQTINELRVAKDAYFRKVNRLERKLNTLLREQQDYITGLKAIQTKGEIPKCKDELLNTPISELDLSIRAYNVVLATLYTISGVKYDKAKLGDLIKLSEEDFLRMRNCGYKTLSEIKHTLYILGFELA